jgi:hypothetical protein
MTPRLREGGRLHQEAFDLGGVGVEPANDEHALLLMFGPFIGMRLRWK